jgi:hypothetical protein
MSVHVVGDDLLSVFGDTAIVRGLLAKDADAFVDDDDDDEEEEVDPAENSVDAARYAFFAAVRDVDTTLFARRQREKRAELRREARAWRAFPTDVDAVVSFRSDRFQLLEKPLLGTLSRLLEQWRDSGAVPVQLAPALPFLAVVVDGAALLQSLSGRVVELLRGGDHVAALRLLGVDGVMSLLSLRITAGTARGVLPPGLRQLWRAFNEAHAGTRLTVGARALTKHFARSSERFWGASIDGPAGDKNVNACRILCNLIDDLQWMNVHALPHDTYVFEIRNSLSYGARWHLDALCKATFRGFLEPVTPDGHENGWLH